MLRPAPYRYYRFGPNVLDCLRGVLWQDGAQVPLTPRVFDILATLVERHGELVTKDDFMRLVWGGTAVEDNNLARQISTLRKLLHERPGQREYIATVTGVGYRFVGTVTAHSELPPELTALVGPATGPALAVESGGDAVSMAPAMPEFRPVSAAPAPREVVAPTLPPANAPVMHQPVAWATPWSTALLAALGVAAIVALVVWPDQSTNAAPVSRTLWQFSHDSGSQFDPAWSPDGTRLALASDRNGNADIWVYGVTDASAVQLTTSVAHDRQPHWSPDGQTIVFRSERQGGGIFVVPATGGEKRQLTSFGANPRYSPSGDVILFTQSEPNASAAVRLFVVPAAGGPPRRVMHSALAGLQPTSAGWAPDGRISVWTRDDAGNRQFLTFPLDGGPATHSTIPPAFSTTAATTQLNTFQWAPSGRHLYFEGRTKAVRNIWRVTIDPSTLNWTSGPEQITIGPGADLGLALSPDGARLSFAVNTARAGIWAFDLDPAAGKIAATGQQVLSGAAGEQGADVSRDGKQLAYRLDRHNRQEIWTRDIEGGEPRLLVADNGWDVTVPKWSADNTRLAYVRRNREDRQQQSVVVVSATPTDNRPMEILRPIRGQEAMPTDWRRDGSALLAACRLRAADRVGICEIAMPPAGSTTGAQLARIAADDNLALYQQRYAPNERWISFIGVPQSDRSTSTVYVMPVAGGPWRPITDGQAYEDKPRWSPDGRILYFISNRDGRFEVWGRRFDPEAGEPSGAPFRVTALEGARQALSPYLADLDMFLTPNRILLPMFESSSRVWMLEQADK